MSDHEQTRQAVAKAIYRAWHNIPAKGSDRFDDPTLYPGTRELAGRMADAAITALAALRRARVTAAVDDLAFAVQAACHASDMQDIDRAVSALLAAAGITTEDTSDA